MKKLIALLAFLCCSSISINAEIFELLFVVEYTNKSVLGNHQPKSPILVPEASLDDHTLYIYDVAYDLTLALVDEDDEVVYTVFVPANTSSVVLPSWLEGDYQLLLIPDEDYYFAGEISL